MDGKLSASDIYTHKADRDFLGRGRFGTVRRCFFPKGGTAAVKIFSVCGSKKEIAEQLRKIESEVDILKTMEESPFIVNVFGLVNMYHYSAIAMEYVPREPLSEFIKKSGEHAPLALRFRILYETATGITHLHGTTFSKRVTHNDVKPENILLDADYHVKICDFGGSNFTYHTSWTAHVRSDASRVHSELYAAPEFLEGLAEGHCRRNTTMDVFSYAMVSYFVLTGEEPIAKNKSEFPEDSKLPMTISSELERTTYQELRRWTIKCWDFSPNQRPKMKEVSEALAKYRPQTIGLDDVEEIVEILNEKFPLESFEKDKDCVTLAKYCHSLLHNCSEHFEESNSVVGSGSSMPAIKVSHFNHVLKKGDEIVIHTSHDSYICKIVECRK